MRSLLHPTLDADPELRSRALAILWASLALGAVVAVGTTVRTLIQPLPPVAFWALVGSAILLGFAPLALRVSSRLTLPAALPSFVLVALPAVVAYAQGGLEIPIAMALPLAPVAGMFFGGRAVGLVTATLALIEVLVFARLHASGHVFPMAPPEGQTLTLARANVLALLVLLGAAFAWLFERRRVRHEASLRSERERFRLALDAAHDGVFDWDRAGGDPYYSEQFLRLLKRDDLGARDPREWLAEPDRARVGASLERLAAEGGALEVECQLETADGPRWFELRALRVSGSGETARLVGAVRDVEERKRAAALKDQLISTVSHELRTPLTGIHGALRLLGGGAAGPLSERGQELVALGERNGRRLMRIVDELLDLQRLQAGELDLELDEVSVADVLAQARTIAEELGVEARLSISEPAPEEIVLCDLQRAGQVWINLIGNAVKFAREGKIEAVARAVDGGIRFELADRGPGVPPEMRDSVFEPFTQVDGTTTRAHGGSGLGLAIVASIVRASGGVVGVVERAGGGAVFGFLLRRTRAAINDRTAGPGGAPRATPPGG
ncbi:MAG: PAS domain-containing sensor histidine kinase [Sandaracinaceae bacterium]